MSIVAELIKDSFGGVCCKTCLSSARPIIDNPNMIKSDENIVMWLLRVPYACCSVCDLVLKFESETPNVDKVRDNFENILKRS